MVPKLNTPGEQAATTVDASQTGVENVVTPPVKTQEEIDAEKKEKDEKAQKEADEKTEADRILAEQTGESGDKSANKPDETNDVPPTTETPTTTPETPTPIPEKTTNPNASLFSKARWSAVALDMAKTMVRDSKHKNDSFFSGFGDKLRLWGIGVISWFVGKSWYNELSEEYRDTLNQKFGIKPTGDDSIFEFGEPAGGETTTLKSYLNSQDIFKAHFGDKQAFDKISALSPFKKDGLTYKQFSDALDAKQISDPVREEQCKKLREAMKMEKPMPADDEKIVDFLGHHADGIAKYLELTDVIYKDQNNESLSAKIGVTDDLTVADAKCEYDKVVNTDGTLSKHPVAITKDSVKVDDVEYKITNPAGASIKSISGVAGSPPEDLSTLQAVVLIGTEEKIINNFLEKGPDSLTDLTIPYEGGELKLEVPKPATEADKEAEPAAPATPDANGETPYDKALASAFAQKNETYSLSDGGNFDFDLPYLDDKGQVNATPAHCRLTENQIKIDDKIYNIEMPITIAPDLSLESVKIVGDNITLTDIDFLGLKPVTHTLKIKEFAEMIDKLRKNSSSLELTLDGQIIRFKLAA